MAKILSKREKTIFYATVTVVFFSIVFNFLVVPVLSKNESLNKDINAAKERLQKYLYLMERRDDIRAKYNGLFVDANGSDAGEDGLISSLSELEKIAKDSNVRIIDIRPQGSSRSPSIYKEALIELKAEGMMEEYLKFTYNIENSPLLFKVKKLHLNIKPNTLSLEGSFSISRISALN
jgi:hypothetical protein